MAGKVRYGKYARYNEGPSGHDCKCRKTFRSKRTNTMSGKYKGRKRGPTGRPRGRPRKNFVQNMDNVDVMN